MKIWRLFPVLAFLFLIPGCASAGPTTQPTSIDASTPTTITDPQQPRPAASVFENYSALFEISFDSPAPWRYQLRTRQSGALREYSLHMEGLDAARNPGDIRMVTDGVTTWMTGPGVEEQCVLFPSGAGLDPDLLLPETLAPFQDHPGLMKTIREEPFAGRASRYALGGPLSYGDWQNVSLETHQDIENLALLQFAMLASGEDPFFSTGAGTLMATYRVENTDAQAIEAVPGCEIAAPLPASASGLVRLPGLVSYESAESLETLRAFYQARLPEQGWAEKEPAEASAAALVLSYQRGAETLQIQVEVKDSGSSVKILVESGN